MIDSNKPYSFRIQYFKNKNVDLFSVYDSEILYGLYNPKFKKLLSYHFDGYLILQQLDLSIPLSQQKLTLLAKKAIFIGYGFQSSNVHFDCNSIVFTKFFKKISTKVFEICYVFDLMNFEDYDQFVKPSQLVVCGKNSEGNLICYEIKGGSILFYQFKKELTLNIS